jgi:glucose/arabinose dehydrogenase
MTNATRDRGRRLALLIGMALCALILITACGSSSRTTAGSAPPNTAANTAGSSGVRLHKIGTFDLPVYVTAPPGDRHRLFVVEKTGVIVVLVNGHRKAQPFLNISHIVNSSSTEQGLLSMAFAPNYATSGRFYVDYTTANNDEHVVQYRRSAHDPNTANPGSARNVLTINHDQYDNHYGAQLQFGPDGDLYVSVGDGGSEGDPHNNGQNTDVLLGKILRIQPGKNGGYSIPHSNPFVGMKGKKPQIWAYGLRNPWRFSFDRLTGAMVIADVGQDREEEVDFAKRGTGAGANYGWSIWEGDLRYKPGVAPHAVFPVLVTHHTAGYCAIIGGYVVRDKSLKSLYGHYVYGDNCKPQINSAVLSEGHARDKRPIGLSVSNMSSFGQDALGRVYAVSLNGPIYRLVPH